MPRAQRGQSARPLVWRATPSRAGVAPQQRPYRRLSRRAESAPGNVRKND
jgi:hypothetical protein